MKKATIKNSYNERLFGKPGFRSAIHLSRFKWIRKVTEEDRSQSLSSVVELGCFDGRLLDYFDLGQGSYVGIDADWEGGMTKAVEKYRGNAKIKFYRSSSPEIFEQFSDGEFDVGFSLETIEHLPPAQVPHYLNALRRTINGRLYISVPNEIGIVFILKWIAKAILYRSTSDYSVREVFWATTGQLEKVRRNEHKGFDYRSLVLELRKSFESVDVVGITFPWAHPIFSITIGISSDSRSPIGIPTPPSAATTPT